MKNFNVLILVLTVIQFTFTRPKVGVGSKLTRVFVVLRSF